MEPTMLPRLIRACLATQTITYKQLVATPELSWYSSILISTFYRQILRCAQSSCTVLYRYSV